MNLVYMLKLSLAKAEDQLKDYHDGHLNCFELEDMYFVMFKIVDLKESIAYHSNKQ